MKTAFKSAGAIIVGFVIGAILSIWTDLLLEKFGIMAMTPFDSNPVWLLVIVVLYRFVFNTFGVYITAALAPNSPMRHAMILWGIGFILSAGGTIAMWDIPPHWYPIVVTLLALPCAYIGGKLYVNCHKRTHK